MSAASDLVARFILLYINEHGRAPTLSEMRAAGIFQHHAAWMQPVTSPAPLSAPTESRPVGSRSGEHDGEGGK